MVKKITLVGNNMTFEDDIQTVKRELDEIVKGSFCAHKTRHENGGGDEIDVGGLSGELADNQPPKAHKASHQNAGGDEIDVGGLSGELADNQPPKNHAAAHQNGGGDEISIAALSGEPADTVNKTGAQTIAGKKTMDEGAIVHAPKTYTPGGAGTATLDLNLGNNHEIQMPAGNITIAISNETNGQYFTIDITQDGVGSRTVTWFITIDWGQAGAPTLSTGANRIDSFGFKCTGVDTYRGYVIGQDWG